MNPDQCGGRPCVRGMPIRVIDVLVTIDRDMPFQQRSTDRPFATVILRARTSRLIDLLQLVPRLLAVLRHS